MKQTLYLLFLLGLTVLSLQAQPLPDGSIATPDYVQILQANLDEERSTPLTLPLENLNVTLGINFFIVVDEFGMDTITTELINRAITDVNYYFEPIGIRFRTDSVSRIQEYPFRALKSAEEFKEITVRYAKPGILNVFILDTLVANNTPSYAYTYFPGDTINDLYIIQPYFNGVNLTTQLGHFLGLLSTHSFMVESELVDGSNCADAGDLICDTYADPWLLGQVDELKCTYFGEMKDANDDFYTPSVAYLMSDSPDKCRCLFTKEQYRRMLFYYKNYRQHMH